VKKMKNKTDWKILAISIALMMGALPDFYEGK